MNMKDIVTSDLKLEDNGLDVSLDDLQLEDSSELSLDSLQLEDSSELSLGDLQLESTPELTLEDLDSTFNNSLKLDNNSDEISLNYNSNLSSDDLRIEPMSNDIDLTTEPNKIDLGIELSADNIRQEADINLISVDDLAYDLTLEGEEEISLDTGIETQEQNDHSEENTVIDISQQRSDAIAKHRLNNKPSVALEFISESYNSARELISEYVLSAVMQNNNLDKEMKQIKAELFSKKPDIDTAVYSVLLDCHRAYNDYVALNGKTVPLANVNLLQIYPTILQNVPVKIYESLKGKVSRDVNGNPCLVLKDLIGDSFLLLECLNHLRSYDDIENRISNKNKSLSEKSNTIRYYFVLKTLKDYRVPKGESCYVEQILIDKNNTNFVCGDCGETSRATQDFMSIGYLPYGGKTNSEYYKLFALPGINKCSHCGKLNILSKREIKEVMKYCNTRDMKEMFKQFKSTSELLAPKFNVTRLTLSAEELEDLLPGRFEVSLVSDENDNLMDLSDDFENAVKRYRDLIKYFKTSLANNPSVIEPVIEDVIHENGSNPSVTCCVNSSMDNFTKIVATILGREYATIKDNAVKSLLHFISDSPLYQILSRRVMLTKQAKLESYRALDIKDRLDLNERIVVYKSLLLDFDEYYSKCFDKIGNIIIEESQILEYLQLAKDRLQKSYDNDVKERDRVLSELKNLTRLYAYVPVSQVTYINSEIIENLCYSQEFREFLSNTTNLMILNSLSAEFMQYWLGQTESKIKTNVNKIINDALSQESLNKCIENLIKALRVLVRDALLFKQTDFTVTGVTDSTEFLKLSKLKEFFINYDEFNLKVAINNCRFIADEQYNRSLYKPFRDLYSEFSTEARQFVEKHGTTDLERLIYYFGDQFSREEIESSYTPQFANLRVKAILKRKDGENFSEFIFRVNSYDSSVNEEIYRELNYDFYNEFRKHISVVNTGSLLYVYYINYTFNLKSTLLFGDIISQMSECRCEDLLHVFSIDELLANKLVSDVYYSLHLNSIDYKKIKVDTILTSMVYVDQDLNDILLERLSVSDKIKQLTESEELFLNGIKYMPREFIDEVYEFYSFRG